MPGGDGDDGGLNDGDEDGLDLEGVGGGGEEYVQVEVGADDQQFIVYTD
jgi:hypothetical protein